MHVRLYFKSFPDSIISLWFQEQFPHWLIGLGLVKAWLQFLQSSSTMSLLSSLAMLGTSCCQGCLMRKVVTSNLSNAKCIATYPFQKTAISNLLYKKTTLDLSSTSNLLSLEFVSSIIFNHSLSICWEEELPKIERSSSVFYNSHFCISIRDAT